jgi:beta-aspartyl-peptidase (threonine type)
MNAKFTLLFFLLSLGLVSQVKAQTNQANSSGKVYGLVIHGGASSRVKKDDVPGDEELYHNKLQEALNAGYAVLDTNGTALDAVTASIKVMEDAGLFDAGKGSKFNADGYCEMDAAIMDGRTLSAGAVAGIQHTKNPITLARTIMEKSPHVLLMGDGAEKFGQKYGFELVPNSYFQTERRRKQWEEIRKQKKANDSNSSQNFVDKSEAFGTVGCVALDKSGNLAAATSTGGTTYKLPGRIGDTPLIGAGNYANNVTCAVSGTGVGEYFIRTVFCHNVSALMEYKGLSLEQASTEALKQLEAIGGHGGCIGIDSRGNIVMLFNTSSMYRGCKMSDGRFDIKLYGDK